VAELARCLACDGPLATMPSVVGRDRMHGIPGSWPVHECLTCGSGTTLPLARADEIGAFYPSRYAPFDVPQGVLATAMMLMQLARDRRFPLESLGRDRGRGVLLDVGCGRGDLAESWVHAGWRVIGVEPSPEAAAVARGRGADVQDGTLETIELRARSLDAAVFRHSLEHVPDPRRDLSRVYEALRPGGRLAVIVPNWSSWQRRAFGECWFPLELPRHRTHFTAEGLTAALAAAGFTAIVLRPGTPLITTTWSLQFRVFGRLLTRNGVGLMAGYCTSLPVALLIRAIDATLHSGDFLHAAAERPAR
jgi:SAM-dependent methyltransferase